jgi:uncharacterized protein (TIGR02391 family)
MPANYKMIALQIGDLIKYERSEKEINLAAQSIFNFNMQEIRISDSITSSRARLFANWVLTLALQGIELDEKNSRLIQFLKLVFKNNISEEANTILENAGVLISTKDFDSRGYHQQIHLHCRQLYRQENYFHAVFEAAKAYNKYVQSKSQSEKDGVDLMMNVFSLNGSLKLNSGESKTEQNIQDGVKFLSAGLMQAMRNPTAHEPAIEWPINKQDCLDMLSFISYLFKQIDKAIIVK